MLSREEAIDDVNNEIPMYSYEAKVIVEEIYDSIGSCADCKFLGDRKVFCIEHGFFVPSNGYCWKFERSENG